MGSVFSKTLRNSAVYATGNFAVRLVGLILIPFLTNTKYLSIADFGAFSILEIILQLLMSIMGLGLYMGLSRFYWDDAFKNEKKSIFFTALGSTVIISVLVSSLVFFFATPLNQLFFQQNDFSYPLKLAAISAALQAILLIPHSLLKMQSRSGYFSLLNIVRALGTLILTYWLLVKNHTGLVGIYEAQILSLLLCIVLTMQFIYNNSTFKLNKEVLKSLTKYSFPLMLSSVMILLLGAFDRLVLNDISGLEDVAVYSLGFKLSNSIKVFVVASIQLALSPILMQKMNDKNHGIFYNMVLQYFSIGLMFVILGISLFGKDLIALFTVEQVYGNAYLVVVLLAFGFYFEMVKDNVVIGLNIEKKTLVSGGISFVSALIGLLLYYLLVPLWGMYGAALAFMIVQIMQFGFVYFTAQHFHYLPYNLLKVGGILLIGAILFGFSWMLDEANVYVKYGSKVVALLLYPLLLFVSRIIDMATINTFLGLIKKPK